MNDNLNGYIKIPAITLKSLIVDKRKKLTEFFDKETEEVWAECRTKTRWSWKQWKQIPLTDEEIFKLSWDDWNYAAWYKGKKLKIQEYWMAPLEEIADYGIAKFPTELILLDFKTLNRLIGDTIHM